MSDLALIIIWFLCNVVCSTLSALARYQTDQRLFAGLKIGSAVAWLAEILVLVTLFERLLKHMFG